MDQNRHSRRSIVRAKIACALMLLSVLTTAGKCSGLGEAAGCARLVGVVGRSVHDNETTTPEPAPAKPQWPANH
jgi:hypothetical protein